MYFSNFFQQSRSRQSAYWKINALISSFSYLTVCYLKACTWCSYKLVQLLTYLKLHLFQFVKVGNAGSNFPSFIFPSLVGRPIIRSAVKVNNVEIKVMIYNIWNILHLWGNRVKAGQRSCCLGWSLLYWYYAKLNFLILDQISRTALSFRNVLCWLDSIFWSYFKWMKFLNNDSMRICQEMPKKLVQDKK